jgi:inosose dehydratase
MLAAAAADAAAVSRRRFVGCSGGLAATALLSRTELPGGLAQSMRFGCAAITWNGDDRRAIREIAAVGFAGIQLRQSAVDAWGERPGELKDLLAEHRLTFVALSSGEVSSDPARADEERSRHLAHAAFLRDCGGIHLQVLDTWPRGRAVSSEDYVRLGRVLTDVGRRTADMGVTLVYHNHMGALGERPDDVARILEATDPRYVRFLLDTAHYQQGGGEPARAVETHADWLALLHIKDVVSPVPGEPSEPYRFVELGRGKVDFHAVFAALARARFSGWAVVELDPLRRPERTPAESATLSRRYLEDELGFEVGHR